MDELKKLPEHLELKLPEDVRTIRNFYFENLGAEYERVEKEA